MSRLTISAVYSGLYSTALSYENGKLWVLLLQLHIMVLYEIPERKKDGEL